MKNTTPAPTSGQQFCVTFGRRTLKNGRITAGTVRAVTITAVNLDAATAAVTYKVHGMTVASEVALDRLEVRP
jgi:hypothetical protein